MGAVEEPIGDGVGELPQDDQTRKDIEAALNQVSGLMTGDLDKIPQVVAAEMSRWLEANKHLDERAAKAAPAKTAETPSKAEPGADEQPAEDEPGADEQPDATLEPAATVGQLPS